MSRTARIDRETSESKVLVELNIDGEGRADISIGVGFYDHMLNALAKDGFEVDKELVTRFPNDPRVFGALQELIAKAAERKVPAGDMQEWTETALNAAEKYGPRFVQETALKYAALLVTSLK